MASLIERSRDAAKRRREKEEKAAAAKAEAAAERRSKQKGKQGRRGPGTIVKGSAPPPTTTKVRKAGTSKAPPPTTTKGRSAKGTAKGTASGSPAATTADHAAAFDKEFAAARKRLGPGGSFTYKGPGPRQGKRFTTDRADDKPASGGFSKVRSGNTSTTIPAGEAQKKPEKEGILRRFGRGLSRSFVPTDDEPKPPGGKRPDRIQTRRGQPVGPWARYDERMKFWRARQKNANNKSAGGRVGKPAKKAAKKKAASRKSSVGMKAGGSVRKPAKKKPLARTSVKTKSPRRP
jgi:hypothetical protein